MYAVYTIHDALYSMHYTAYTIHYTIYMNSTYTKHEVNVMHVYKQNSAYTMYTMH